MIVVLNAGGAGTRLWPLSTDKKPKHTLSINNQESLLQQAYSRAKTLTKNVYVVTEKSHADLVKSQIRSLKKEHLIIEPMRRGTATCISLALSEVSKQYAKREIVTFIHTDHFIPDVAEFTKAVREAVAVSRRHNTITLIGTKPAYPSTGFGYIQKGKSLDSGGVFEVVKFKEKPDAKLAENYVLSKKYLWNTGMFVGSIAMIEGSIRASNNYLSDLYASLQGQESVQTVYSGAHSENIDTALLEKLHGMYVVESSFTWTDLGSFQDVYSLSKQDKSGNYTNGNITMSNSFSSYVYNESKAPLLVVGVEDLVIVNTSEGTLVCSRKQSQNIGPLVQALKKNGNYN